MTIRRHWLGAVLTGCFTVRQVLAQTPAEVAVRIGAEDDWAPFSSVIEGKPVGMAVELVQAIFAEAGIPLDLVPLPYARCMDETKRGRLAGCFNTLPDAGLRREYLFHAAPLFTDELWILARADSPATQLTVRDLSGKQVLVTNGYTYGDAFEANGAIRRMTAPYDINALRMLAARRAEFAVVYRRVTQHLLRGAAKDLQGQLKPVGKLENAALYLSFSRQYPGVETIIARFEKAHARLRRNGALQKIERRWS